MQLCCAVLGCWLTEPLNRWFGRRGTIFICATISFLACIWQGVTNSWQHLFVARFVLGIGIGPKSSTVPVYAAECSPPAIRGALVMMWQMWTAFGIMLGYVADLALFKVPDKPGITGLNWRLMLSSVPICVHYSAYIHTNIQIKAGIPALFLMAQVFFCPESPRWLMSKGRYEDAFKSLERLRRHPVQAARDLYCPSCSLLVVQPLIVRQTSTSSSRRRMSSLVDEIAILNYSPSLVIAAHLLPPSSSCSCEFSSLSSRIPAHVVLTTIPGNNSAESTLSPTIRPPYSRRPTSRRSKLCSHRGALVP